MSSEPVAPSSPRSAARARRLVLGPSTSWWSYPLVAAGWLGVGAGAVGLLARSVAWDWQPLIVAAAFFVVLTVVAVLGGALLAMRRAWAGPVAAAGLAVVAVVVLVPSYVASTPSEPSGRSLTVLQANLRLGSADPQRLVARVRAQHVDVLTVEELTPAEMTRLTRAGLSRLLPYHLTSPYPGGAGTGLWSRYPLTDQRRDDRFTFELLAARITPLGAAETQLVAVHLLPPWPYPAGTWRREVGLLHRLLTRQPTGVPVVVGGDFNATLDNAQLRGLLSGGYQDAAAQSGAGILATYPADRFFPPVLPIDHVVIRGASAADVRTLALAGSDHRALLAHLELPAASSRPSN